MSLILEKYNGNLPWLKQNTILIGKAGSHSYGLNTEASDEDYKGIAIPPASYFLGWLNKFEQAEFKFDNAECVIYEIRKYFDLAAACNPNIIELLWLDKNDYIYVSDLGKILIDNRDYFLSKKARHTFSGYAISQLKRINTHRHWLLNPITKEPQRSDFGLPKDKSLLSHDQRGAAENLLNRGTALDLSDNFLDVLDREKKYHAARKEWEQFTNWEKTRNKKRAALEAKFGYDTKHAMHLVRLMRMCREILLEKTVFVKRLHDRDELMAIRNGEWSYEKLISWAETQDLALEELYTCSTLQHEPNRKFLDSLCVDILKKFLSNELR